MYAQQSCDWKTENWLKKSDLQSLKVTKRRLLLKDETSANKTVYEKKTPLFGSTKMWQKIRLFHETTDIQIIPVMRPIYDKNIQWNSARQSCDWKETAVRVQLASDCKAEGCRNSWVSVSDVSGEGYLDLPLWVCLQEDISIGVGCRNS